MSTEVKTTNVEEVLPNDEDLGRRNCRWREFVQKYEDATQNQSDHSMDIDTAMGMLDQDMSDGSSVSDVLEASSEEQSPPENVEEIQRQLKVAVPLRKREWEANGLKEILDDNEFRMLSHEKVENWLRNHMHSITGHYNVHYKTEQVTTVTETRMDADADSLYSVDTAQYIRSNKQISNKLKVTTMIKQYSVTSSVRRLTSLGVILDEQKSDRANTRLSLPLPRTLTKSDSACDVKKPLPEYNCAAQQRKAAAVKRQPRAICPSVTNKPAAKATTTTTTATGTADRRDRRKVFKKTIPRKGPGPTGSRATVGCKPTAAGAKQRYDPEQMYTKALEQCARQKKAKPISQRKVSTRFANRMQYSLSSSSSESDSDEVFFTPIAARDRPTSSSRAAKPPSPAVANTRTNDTNPTDAKPTSSKAVKDSPNKTASPTEREIVGPFQSITLSASKRQLAQPAGPAGTTPPKKWVGLHKDGYYYEEGLVIYRPTTVRPDADSSERINLRVGDLNLTGVTKERHLTKFQAFNYFVHPNSTVCFYPSDSADTEEHSDTTDTEHSYDDPIQTFRPRNTDRLNVVEIRYHNRPNPRTQQNR
ncbi:uncharacterized protein LOC118507883 [Anopheles stephensi]|uniref:uncharacterized protein LOC118507883 n=1 Tax=Anopheles stephensi TaxID=30069 RepID=UPI00165886C1|nr:uncharacterized protein LOC118507883 [Anopheles stephensi]